MSCCSFDNANFTQNEKAALLAVAEALQYAFELQHVAVPAVQQHAVVAWLLPVLRVLLLAYPGKHWFLQC